MKKILSLVLCLVLALGVCSFAYAEELEPVKIKVLVGGDENTSSLDDPIGQKIYEDLKIEIEFVAFNESAYEKAQMQLAANNWGDLDLVCTAKDEITTQYIAADAFVNLDDYRDLMPNFYEYCANEIPYWRNYDAEGGLYVWQNGPDQIQMTTPCLDIVVRTDALEAAGWPDLDTTDDYIAFLKESMERFPMSNGMPTIGICGFQGQGGLMIVSTYLPRHSGYSDVYKQTCYIDVDNQEFVSKVRHPYFKAAMEFFNTCYREGILDPDFFVDDMSVTQAKANAGTPISVWFMNWVNGAANNEAIARGQEDAQYITMPIRLQIAKDEGRNVRYELYTAFRADNTYGILKTSPNAERICMLLNYMATEEMSRLCCWGTEGVDYTVDAEGVMHVTDEFVATMSGEGGADYRKANMIDINYSRIFPVRTFALRANGNAGLYSNDPSYTMAAATERQKEAYASLGWENNVSGWTDNPNFEFVPFDLSIYQAAGVLDAESEAGKTELKIIDYVDGAIPQLVTCETVEDFEAFYAEMCSTVETMGEDMVLAVYNEQYQATAARIEELKGY